VCLEDQDTAESWFLMGREERRAKKTVKGTCALEVVYVRRTFIRLY
jgi:hypothetical protein